MLGTDDFMYAAIDLGSNSFRLHIARFKDGKFSVVRSSREPNRIAAGLDRNNVLSKESIVAALHAIRRIRFVVDMYPVRYIRAIATNTLRVAVNASEFLTEAEDILGFPITVVSGPEEATLIYTGVSHVLGSDTEKRLVIDIGGGSTEFISGQGFDILAADSVGVGTVSQSLDFFPGGYISRENFDAAAQVVRTKIADTVASHKRFPRDVVYGSSGTMRATGEIISAFGMGNARMNAASLQALRDFMIGAGHVDKLRFPAVRRDRTRSVLGGLTILLVLFEELGIPELTPIDAGLRMGVLWNLRRENEAAAKKK